MSIEMRGYSDTIFGDLLYIIYTQSLSCKQIEMSTYKTPWRVREIDYI